MKGQIVTGPKGVGISIIVEALELLGLQEQGILGMVLVVEVAGVEVEPVNAVHRMGIEVMVVRSAICIRAVNRIVVGALPIVQCELRPIRHNHAPANIESLRVAVRGVIGQTWDVKRADAIIVFRKTDGAAVVASSEKRDGTNHGAAIENG